MYRAHRIRRLLFLGIVTITVYNVILMFNKPLENAQEFSEKVSWNKERMEMTRNVWVSMGLCFSKNTQLFGKVRWLRIFQQQSFFLKNTFFT